MIDMNKKYRTRDGQEVRLYANDVPGAWPIHGAVKLKSSEWSLRQWYEGGRYSSSGPHDFDLIEVKPERWYPIWDRINGQDYFLSGDPSDSREQAMSRRNRNNDLPVDAWKAI